MSLLTHAHICHKSANVIHQCFFPKVNLMIKQSKELKSKCDFEITNGYSLRNNNRRMEDISLLCFQIFLSVHETPSAAFSTVSSNVIKNILPGVDYQSAPRTCKLHPGWLFGPGIAPLHHLRHRDPPNVLKNRCFIV